MTPIELRQAKQELERKIYELVEKFTSDTGFFVSDIDVPLMDITSFTEVFEGRAAYRYGASKIEVKL